ncbi:MAG: ATP-binding protein [Chlamydiales bacterium]|nr:ATP-binding protein [Chlamydiales bacterium]
MKYRQRTLEQKLKEYVDFFSVVAVTGPRQSGKSTLIKQHLKDYTYVSFDEGANVTLFYNDPEKFMRIHHHKVIFDEVQKVPEIFDYLKLAVDEDRETAGKFILTGSSQFSLSKEISESLAGRIGLLTLLPYSYSEMPKKHLEDSLFFGAYPELVHKDYKLFDDWYASYIETYIEKDLRTLANVGDLRDFQRLIQLLAANTSQILNYSMFSNALGVDVKTITRWISILEASYIIFLVPPYYKNLGKRIVKRPKVYFYDVGLVSHLCGISNRDLYEKGPMHGALFENYLVAECLKLLVHQKLHSKLYFYRTSHGVEVDLIIDHRQYRELIEIKTSETFHSKMTKPIEGIIQPNDKGILLYQGKTRPYLENVQIQNYKEYLAN